MRILHISKYYFPYLGGVESICKYLVERMPKHITSVVCFNNQRENAVDEINGHRIYRIATFVNIARQALSLSYKNWIAMGYFNRKTRCNTISLGESFPSYIVAISNAEGC